MGDVVAPRRHQIASMAQAVEQVLNHELIAHPAPADLTWADTIHLTGVNFTTLGYTQIS